MALEALVRTLDFTLTDKGTWTSLEDFEHRAMGAVPFSKAHSGCWIEARLQGGKTRGRETSLWWN